MKRILTVLLALSLAALATGNAWAASRKAPDKKSELKDKSAAPAAAQEARPQTPPAKQAGKPAGHEGKSNVRQAEGARPSGQFGGRAVKPEARKDAGPGSRAFAEGKGGSGRGAAVGRKGRKASDEKQVRKGARPEFRRDIRGVDTSRARGMQRARQHSRGWGAGPRNDMRHGGEQAQKRAMNGRWGRQPYGRQWTGERPGAGRPRQRMMRSREMDVRGMGRGVGERMHADAPRGRGRAVQPDWGSCRGQRGLDRRGAMIRSTVNGGHALGRRDKRTARDNRARPQVRGEKGPGRLDKDRARPKADWREKERFGKDRR